MDFDTYFNQLVLREGDWLVPAKQGLKPCWPHISPELDRAAVELYQDVFGKPSGEGLKAIDDWFYRANDELHHRRPIDLMAMPEGVHMIREVFVRMSAGMLG